MTTIKEQILNEILEHTIDCDYNRAQHFKKNNDYSRISKFLEFTQMFFLLCLITYYMLKSENVNTLAISVSNINFNFKIEYLAIAFSILATTAQIFSYFANYTDLAAKHWLAAQAYSRLYRECQFFYVHYGSLDNIYVLRQKANDISDELNNLNLLSPSLDSKTYEKVDKSYKKSAKTYPIQNIILDVRLSNLNNVVDTIKEGFCQYPLEIILFGSYLTNNEHRDIDIAVIVYSDLVDENKLKAVSIQIEKQYFQLGLNLDISIILQNDLSNVTLTPFLINIKKGHRLYISPAIKRNIDDRLLNEIDYKPIVDCYYNSVLTEGQKTIVDKHNFVLKSYHYLYYVIASILYKNNISWSGEESMERAFLKVIKDDIRYQDIYLLFALLRKEKNSQLVLDAYRSLNISDILGKLAQIHSLIQDIFE